MDLPEREFNPEDYPREYVVVGGYEGLPSVLQRVEEAWTITPNVVLIIPRGTQAFHSTHDFLALGKIQDQTQVRVSIASHDPIIIGLARVLGFYVLDPPPDHPALASDPVMGSGPRDDMEKPTAPLSIGNAGNTGNAGNAGNTGSTTEQTPEWVLHPAPPIYQRSSTTSAWLTHPGDTSAHLDSPEQPWADFIGSELNPGQRPRPGMPPPRTRPRQTGQLPSALLTDTSLPAGVIATQPPVSPTPTGRIKARRIVPKGKAFQNRRLQYGGRMRASSWGRSLTAFLIVVLIALIGGSAYAYVYLPQGTVSVTPLSKPTSDLPVEITVLTGAPSGAAPGKRGIALAASGDNITQTAPSITAQMIHNTVQEEGTRPSTATRQIAKGKATGTIRFTNRTSGTVTVPAGTQFKASNGVTVRTTQAGNVPPTVFGASFGTLDVPIVATVEGPDGNIGAGQISGVYGGNLLNYNNLAMQGGSIETLKVVKQEDIDALVAELRSKAEGKAASAVLGLVGSGQQLITQTISLGNAKFEADHKAGEDAEAVHVTLTAEAQAYVYKDSDMHDSVAQAVLDSVQSNIPRAVAPTLDLGSVQYSPPVIESSQPGRVVYRTTATGRVTFALTPELAGQIRELVKGQAINQARNLIFSNYGSYLSPDSIEAKVLWFNIDKLPNNTARIDVEPTGPLNGYTPSTLPAVQGTPDPRSVP